jgi:hypothetical protein
LIEDLLVTTFCSIMHQRLGLNIQERRTQAVHSFWSGACSNEMSSTLGLCSLTRHRAAATTLVSHGMAEISPSIEEFRFRRQET